MLIESTYGSISVSEKQDFRGDHRIGGVFQHLQMVADADAFRLKLRQAQEDPTSAEALELLGVHVLPKVKRVTRS